MAMKAVMRWAQAVRSSLRTLSEVYAAVPALRTAIGVLFSLNLGFILLHALSDLSGVLGLDPARLADPKLQLNNDSGYAERLNHLQTAVCAGALFYAAFLSREILYGAWSLVFGYAAFDDALLVHERIGAFLVARISLPAIPGLRPQDTGELLLWAAMGTLLLAPLVLGFVRGTARTRAFGLVFAVLLACLVGFAVVLDMIHMAVGEESVAGRAMLLVEDGGEMLTLATACATALLLCTHLATTARHGQTSARSEAAVRNPKRAGKAAR